MEFVRPGRSRWIARALCALVVVILAGAAARAQTFTVTRGANGGNRSLRWAITRANANPGSTIAFNIPTSDSRYDAARGVWRIQITSALPVMTGAGTILDGTTQTANQGNTNPVTLGTGGSVGVDGLSLPLVAGPEIEIVDAGGLNIGFDVNASNITIRGIAVYGFGNASNNNSHGDIRVGNVTNTMIEQCVLGTPANLFADPGAGTRSPGDRIRIVNGDNGTVRGNLIGFSQGKGVQFSTGANGWLVEGNEIRRNGITNANLDAIDIENGSGGATIRGNLLIVSEACGVDSYQSSGSNNIVNNDVIGNGIGAGGNLETPGIRLYGSGSVVDRNVVHSNVGAGVMVTNGSSGNRITRNSIYDNGPVTGQIGIDLLRPTDNSSLGTSPYVTPNDSGDSDSGGNGLLNFPVLLAATLGGGQLTLTGFARPGSSIEWFEAALDPSGFGEGRTYLATALEGSAADQDSGTGTYASPVNGLNVGTDTTNRFRFTIPVPGGVSVGTVLTATATVGGNTSEFAGRVIVAGVPDVTLLKSVLPAGNRPPGVDLTYTVIFTNGGGDDAESIILSDPVPPETDFKLGSPFENLGSTGLSATVEYSDDDGGSWGYLPLDGGGGAPSGYDRDVTHIRWVFTGTLSSAAPDNQGNVGFSTRIQ